MASATRSAIWARSSMRTMVKGSGLKECLRAFWEERALPSGVLGPVDLRALARLAATRSGDVGIGQAVACGWRAGADGGGKRLGIKGRFLKILVNRVRGLAATKLDKPRVRLDIWESEVSAAIDGCRIERPVSKARGKLGAEMNLWTPDLMELR